MIPEYLLAKIEKSDVIYRCIGNEMKNGILACGFMRKETADRSQYHFSNEYYSCFVLLRGSGEYIAEDGTACFSMVRMFTSTVICGAWGAE